MLALRYEMAGSMAITATQKLSERQVTKQCIDYAKAHGWRCIRFQSGLFARPLSQSRVRIGEPGLPDWLMLRPSVGNSGVYECLFVEFKAEGKAITPSQQAWRMEAKRAGFDAECFNSFAGFESYYRSKYVD